ncbi:MAG: hypothetical protein NXI24_22530 [bacterium]|nr:hypothetical protein [bacterium]
MQLKKVSKTKSRILSILKPERPSLRRVLGIAVAGMAIAVAYFGVSVRVVSPPTGAGVAPGSVAVSVPELQPVYDVLEAVQQGGTPVAFNAGPGKQIVFSGPAELAAAEDNWAFVRQSATWANGNSTFADNLITGLKNSGLLTNSPSQLATTTVLSGVTYKLKLETNGTCNPTASCQNISSSAYTGTKTFNHRFKLWRASDNLDVVELLFDDIDSPATGDGVLLNYRLGILDATLSDNPNLIVESYISGASPNRRQTYSWGAAFNTTGTAAASTSDRGRVVLEEMTVGLKGGGTSSGALCVRIAARTVSQTITGCGTGNFYYALAYGQKTLTNFETTALSGIAVNDLTTNGQICGIVNLGFGTFNGAGFLADGQSSSTVPDGFPDPSVNGGYPGVQALFNKIDTSGAGAGGFDDLQQSTIDGLNSSIAFHPASEAPGF